MTKKGSIFNFFPDYLKIYPLATLSWLWVVVCPALGSAWILKNYQLLLTFDSLSWIAYLLFILIASLVMGLALLPTTLSAVISGFLLGWTGLPAIILAYSMANVIGYYLGKLFNSGLMELLEAKNPKFLYELEKRKSNEGKLIFFIRISPVIPFAISNFLFASLQVPLRKVLIYGIPGMLPRTILAFLAGILANDFLGAREKLNDPIQIGFVLVFLLISIWGIWVNWKKSKA